MTGPILQEPATKKEDLKFMLVNLITIIIALLTITIIIITCVELRKPVRADVEGVDCV